MARPARMFPKDCWLFDWNGKLLKTVQTESSNTSGLAYGNGHVWMGANGGAEGIYEDRHGLAHRLAPPDSAGSGRQWRRLPRPDVA